jgi:agmatine deiminase
MIIFGACRQKQAPPPPKSAPPAPAHRQPAEFEPAEAIWLLWSLYDHKAGLPNSRVTLDIIRALAPSVKVKLIVPNDSVRQAVQQLVPADLLELGKLTLYTLPYNEFWARDMGPSFVVDSQGLAIADFNFNGWGGSTTDDPLMLENEKLDEKVAALLQLPIVSTNMITEGGDHELNGKGVLLVSETVEQNRNPDMSLEAMEAEFRRVLGVKKVIWLKKGVYEDDHTFLGAINGPKGQKLYPLMTTNGHIDEYVRFVNENTLLLAAVDSAELKDDPISRENAKRMEENYRILKNAVDQDGKPFNIVRMPMPQNVIVTLRPGDGAYEAISAMEYRDGSKFPKGKPVKGIAAASYLNFLIANEVVLVAKYWKPGADPEIGKRDEAAQAVLRSVFPNKKIVPIDALPINLGGGGIHCITINEPKVVKGN